MILNEYVINQINLIATTSLKLCNPSICKNNEQWMVLVRAVEEDKQKRNRNGYFYTENWIYHFDESFQLINSYVIDDNEHIQNNEACHFGLEDGRLFNWKGHFWILFTGLNIVNNKFLNTMCLGRLEGNKIVDFNIIKSPNNLIREKNWIPLVKDQELYFLYQANPIEIYHYKNNQLNLFYKDTVKSSGYYLSGSSTAIPINDDYMFVTHHREKINFLYGAYLKLTNKKEYKKKKIIFYHQFHYLDNSFKKINSSKKFILENKGIEFCAGLAITDDKVLLSYGVADKEAKIATYLKTSFFTTISENLNFKDKGWMLIDKNKKIPEIDLLLLNYNNFEKFGKKCLDSIYVNEIENINLFVLDNGSKDDSPVQLEKYLQTRNVNLILSKINLGYAKGMNHLAKQGDSEWLLLVNSDVVLPKNLLKDLSSLLGALPENIAAIGPVTNQAGNEQKLYINKLNQQSICKQLDDITEQKTNIIYDAYRLDFYFVAIRRKIWEKLNGLDESFGLGYYEDFDFCLRIKNLGEKIAFTEDLYVYHYGSGSFTENTKKLIRGNKLKILEKHSKIDFPHIREANLEVLKKYNVIEKINNKYMGLNKLRKENRLSHLHSNYPKSFFKKIYWWGKIKLNGF